MSSSRIPPAASNRPKDWRPRLVALDIDGTVVDHDGRLPESVHQAVSAVRAAGVPVVLATGRSWHGTQPVFDQLDLPPGPVVCSNGAVVVSYPPQEIRKAVTFDPRTVIEKVADFAPGTLIAVEEIGRGYRLNDHFPSGDLTGEMVIEDLDQLSARPVTRIILRDPHRSTDDFLSLAAHLGMHGMTYYIGWSAWLDIAPQGVNKASALAEVAREFDVDAADVLAFGDGTNDLEMLSWAGRGLAIGGSLPVVLEAADAVTPTFEEGGLVAELLHWFG